MNIRNINLVIDENQLVQNFMFSAMMRLRDLGWTKDQATAAADSILDHIQKSLEAWRSEAVEEITRFTSMETHRDRSEAHMEDQVQRVVLPSFYALKGFDFAGELNLARESHRWN